MLPLHAQSKLPKLPAVSPRLVLRQHGAPFRVTRDAPAQLGGWVCACAEHGTLRRRGTTREL